MSATIRNFEKRDQEVVRSLVLEGLAERWGPAFDPSYNQDILDIHSYYVEHHRATVVVLEDSEHGIIGCGILLPLPAEDIYGTWCSEQASRTEQLTGHKLCRMMRLSVAKDHRGKGYAKKIIQHLINAAKEQGFDRILVETETLWTSAVQIYRAMGFQVVEAGEENIHYEYEL